MGYLAFNIDASTREKLLGHIPAAYLKTVADHITIQLTKKPEVLPAAQTIDILGIADDGNGLQALVVAVDGQRLRPDGKPYHITWSLDPEKMAPADFDPNPKPEKRKAQHYKPAHSGALVADHAQKEFIKYFDMPVSLGGATAVYNEDSPPQRAPNLDAQLKMRQPNA